MSLCTLKTQKKDSQLIGQFGVGFYSAFMVAKSVKVYSHSWKKDEPGHVWSSDGSGSYEVEAVADHIADTLFIGDARVRRVEVKIVKLALATAAESIGMTLVRERP